MQATADTPKAAHPKGLVADNKYKQIPPANPRILPKTLIPNQAVPYLPDKNECISRPKDIADKIEEKTIPNAFE